MTYMKNNVELMNLFWTTAGVFPGVGDISRFEFKDRVEAAAKAGFRGIGIWHTDLEHTLQHRTLQEMKMILDDNGVNHIELEFLTDWFLDGARKAESDSRKRRLLEALLRCMQNISKSGISIIQNVPCPELLMHLRHYAKRRRITGRRSVLSSWLRLCSTIAQAERGGVGFLPGPAAVISQSRRVVGSECQTGRNATQTVRANH